MKVKKADLKTIEKVKRDNKFYIKWTDEELKYFKELKYKHGMTPLQIHKLGCFERTKSSIVYKYSGL